MRLLGRLTGKPLVICVVVLAAASSASLGSASPAVHSLAPLRPSRASLGQVPPATESVDEPATPTAAPPAGQQRLTEPGCCSRPSWSLDSARIGFLDKPSDSATAGVYAVPAGGGPESLVFRIPGVLSRDWSLGAFTQDGQTFVMRLADGERWLIPDEGRSLRFSPSGKNVAWIVASRGVAFPDQRQQAVWLARSDGTQARKILTIIGGGLIGWDDDEQALLLSGRVAGGGQTGIWSIDLASGRKTMLHAADGILDPLLSADGRWVAFTVALQSDPGLNGLWLMRTDGSVTLKVTPYGAYRWRAKDRLLLIPLDTSGSGAALWEINAVQGSARQLTRPEDTPLPIANNDWSPSPDGKSLVYVSTIDRAIWKLDLPADPSN